MNKQEQVICFMIEELRSSFEYAELELLALNFQQVYLIILGEYDTHRISPNIKVIKLDFNGYSFMEALKSLPYLPLVAVEFFKNQRRGNPKRSFLSIYSELSRTRFIARYLLKQLTRLNVKVDIFYSFWFGMLANASTFLPNGAKKVIRSHGSDLFEDRLPHMGNIPLRGYFIAKSSLVVSVSEAGVNYLKNRYPKYTQKFHYAPLGTKDYGINPLRTTEAITLVSCAHIRNIKRIHKIAETLGHCHGFINWIHFGGKQTNDPTLAILESNLNYLKASKTNISFDLRGEISNEDLMEFYKNNHVSLFISLSETEGVPVSIMEAISFGIPIIATEVGGCAEIVTEEVGLLVDKDFNCVETAVLIDKYAKFYAGDVAIRRKVRRSWENRYEQGNNFGKFKKQLLEVDRF